VTITNETLKSSPFNSTYSEVTENPQTGDVSELIIISNEAGSESRLHTNTSTGTNSWVSTDSYNVTVGTSTVSLTQTETKNSSGTTIVEDKANADGSHVHEVLDVTPDQVTNTTTITYTDSHGIEHLE